FLFYYSSVLFFFFFFSSRRRHTRCLSDWSSDVCSSDLTCAPSRRTTCGQCKYRCAAEGLSKFVTRKTHHQSALSTRLWPTDISRSEEHTSELQSLRHLVCRLLLEKKKNTIQS